VTKRVEFQWGTAIGVEVLDERTPEETTAALDGVYAWFARVDELFSTWRGDSEVTRLAEGTLALFDESPEVAEVLAVCEDVRRQSGGAYDIEFATHPDVERRDGRGAIDPSGVVKGWALERAAADLIAHGFARFSINAGGDVLTRGRAGFGAPWRIGIQHPWQRDAVAAVVQGHDLAVATSGQYEQRDHIVVPDSGKPARGLASVTVIGPDLAYCDGYATAAVVLGDEGMAFVAGVAGYEAMGITDDERVVMTEGFGDYRAS
jgi:thiamine biosynthesis lipoprotein